MLAPHRLAYELYFYRFQQRIHLGTYLNIRDIRRYYINAYLMRHFLANV